MKFDMAEARKNAGFSTQEQFAKYINVPRSTLAKWEAGITRPRIDMLSKLAKALGCTVDDLLRERDQDSA